MTETKTQRFSCRWHLFNHSGQVKAASLVAALACLASLGSVQAAPKPKAQSKKLKPTSSAKPKTPAPVAAKAKKPSANKKSTTKPKEDYHGPGLVVGEPVVLPSTAGTASDDNVALAAFGAGCSRWLQLNVGGQGELERTSLWSYIDDARRQMKRGNWCLKEADVPTVTGMLGASHVVLGTIAPLAEPDSYELRYQVVDALLPKAKQKPVVLSLKGTKAEILAQLPTLATELSRALGVKSPQGPASVAIDADAMTLLGKGGWVYAEKATPEEVKQIGGYAAQEPLAALLALEYNEHEGAQANWEYRMIKSMGTGKSFIDSELKRTLVNELLTKLSPNSLAHAEICAIDPNQITPYFEQFKAFSQKYPNNYALDSAHLLIELSKGNKTDQIAPYVIYSGYKNPYTWLLMAKCLGAMASARRGGRVASLISEADWKVLNSLYENWQTATRRAASFDPQNIEAWKALAVAATFNGDEVTADGAFWKAYKLNPDDLENLQWGLQMYQPKWGGDPDKLAKIIAASRTPTHIIYLGDDVARTLYALDEKEQAEAVKQQTLNELNAQFLPHQREFWPAFRLAAYTHSGTDYLRLVSLRPNSSAVHWLMAMSQSAYAPQSEIGYLLNAMRLDPNNGLLRRELAVAYINDRQFEKGADQLETYLKESPYDRRSFRILGLAYYFLDKTEQALAAYSRLAKLDPESRDPDLFLHLCDLQTRTGQLDKALENGEKVIELYPDVDTMVEQANDQKASTSVNAQSGRVASSASWAYAFYGWALFKDGRIPEATQRSQQAIKLYSLNPAPHACLGEIYLSQNQLDKAKAEWELAVKYANVSSSDPLRGPYYGEMAKAQLKKYGELTATSNPAAPTAP